MKTATLVRALRKAGEKTVMIEQSVECACSPGILVSRALYAARKGNQADRFEAEILRRVEMEKNVSWLDGLRRGLAEGDAHGQIKGLERGLKEGER